MDRRSGVFVLGALALLGATACQDPIGQLATAEPGVVFSYPNDGQLDVPLGTHVVVTFSREIDAQGLRACTGDATDPTKFSGPFCVVGPSGPITTAPVVTPDGKGIELDATLDAGAHYEVYVAIALADFAKNLPATGPVFSFTTRSDIPRSSPPTLVAVNGGDPMDPESFRPMLESSTIRLVFSEPLDPRTVKLAGGAIELVDTTTDQPVPATLLFDGIHVAIDPIDDLVAGHAYGLSVGTSLADASGQPVAPQIVTLTPRNSLAGKPPIAQVLRTRQDGDPTVPSHAGAEPNVIHMDKPLIGQETSKLLPSTLAAELSDPKALGGPIGFTIRKGQRLRATGLDVQLGGVIPVGLSTGDIQIELLTDGGGRMYRNPFLADSQRPENDDAPLYVDLSLDIAVYAVDPTGNAVLAQTVLGVQASGTVTATAGVLDIQTTASMDLALLGVTRASSNLVMELITDAHASPEADHDAPHLVATLPGAAKELPVDAGVELIFDEPVDLERLRAGGAAILGPGGTPIPTIVESHGSAVVLRPVTPLPYSTSFQIALTDVADLAGNTLAAQTPIAFQTPRMVATDKPLTVVAVHPGVPCALDNGHCSGGKGGDDLYHPFELPANQHIEVAFTQPPTPTTVTLGAACNSGSVRVETLDNAGACTGVVPGTMSLHDRRLVFVPDEPWTPDATYRLTLVSGTNSSCNAGEVCGISGDAASFDPLAGADDGDGGGPNLIIAFHGAPASDATFLMATTDPFTDINGSGTVDSNETRRDDNRAAMRIVDTTGGISDATFDEADCVPETPEKEACLYLTGAMPTQMMPVTTDCPLPDGNTAEQCMPVILDPEVMYGTSVGMTATAIIDISTDTKTSVMRVRQPANGPVTGYIYDNAGTPTLSVALDLYMDAPDMSITLASHDLHSKPMSAVLSGPVTFLPDGRIAIRLANIADIPVEVNVDATILTGSVKMIVPQGLMQLSLVSPALRGAP